MLYLLFHIGAERYALRALRVLEVLPLVELRPIPLLPPGVAGVFQYQGQPVPVVDMTELVLGTPAPPRFSTRVLLVKYSGPAGEDRTLGLIAERATSTVRRRPEEFIPTGVLNERAPYLDALTSDDRGMIQELELEKLLAGPVRSLLFPARPEDA